MGPETLLEISKDMMIMNIPITISVLVTNPALYAISGYSKIKYPIHNIVKKINIISKPINFLTLFFLPAG